MGSVKGLTVSSSCLSSLRKVLASDSSLNEESVTFLQKVIVEIPFF